MAAPRTHTRGRHESLYQRLLCLYPAGFRREYGEEMVLVFGDRLRDETGRGRRGASTRVWLRVVGDLAASAPKQQLEALMSTQQATPVQASAVLALAALAVLATAYAGPLGLIPFLAVAAWLFYQERRGQYVGHLRSTWRLWVVRGVGLLAIAWVPAVAWLAVSEWAWAAMMLITFVAAVLVVIGLAMGVRDRHRDPATPK